MKFIPTETEFFLSVDNSIAAAVVLVTVVGRLLGLDDVARAGQTRVTIRGAEIERVHLDFWSLSDLKN